MICILDPHEDEILYSVIARTLDSLPGVLQYRLFDELYGSKQGSPSVQLPVGLDRLLSRIQPWSRLSTRHIIDNLTLYPYYAAFASDTQKKEAIRRMQVGITNFELGGISQYLRSPHGKRYLCLCTQCVEQDRLKYGEAHYRRQHQIPTAWICQTHGTPLLQTQAVMRKFTQSRSNTKMISLEKAINDAEVPDWVANLDTHQIKALNQIAQAGKWLLHNKTQTRSKTSLRDQYQYYFKSLGYIDDKAQFLTKQVDTELEAMFSFRALESMGHQSSRRMKGSWHLIVSGRLENKESNQTLHHLLLMTLFGMSPEEFIGEKRSLSLSSVLFGPPPYPCANKFCPHYLHNIIKEKPKTSKGRVTYTFTCPHCEYAYELAPGASLDEALPVFYGHLWDNEIIRVASDETVSRNEACKRLGVSVDRLRRAAKRLNITQWIAASERTLPPPSEPWGLQRQERINTIERHRNSFLAFVELHPDYSRSQIKKQLGATSLYLARYDRAWYEEHAPALARRRRSDDIKS